MSDCPFFQTLHDETRPVGNLGRGTHYSVLRAPVWHDEFMNRLERCAFLDFAIIWDEDHDDRVIDAIMVLYISGMLAPVRYIGERKGTLSVLLAPDVVRRWTRKRWSSIATTSTTSASAWKTHGRRKLTALTATNIRSSTVRPRTLLRISRTSTCCGNWV